MNRNTLPPIIYNNNNRQQYSENDNFSNSYQIMRSQTPFLDNQNSNNNNIISYQNMMKEIRELKLSLKNQLINQNELEKKLIDSYKLLSQQDNIIRLNASKINEHDLKITNVLNSFNNFLKIQEKTNNIINDCQDKVNNKLLPVNIFTTFKSQILANNLSVKENLDKIISYNDNTELILQDLKNTDQNNLNLLLNKIKIISDKEENFFLEKHEENLNYIKDHDNIILSQINQVKQINENIQMQIAEEKKLRKINNDKILKDVINFINNKYEEKFQIMEKNLLETEKNLVNMNKDYVKSIQGIINKQKDTNELELQNLKNMIELGLKNNQTIYDKDIDEMKKLMTEIKGDINENKRTVEKIDGFVNENMKIMRDYRIDGDKTIEGFSNKIKKIEQNAIKSYEDTKIDIEKKFEDSLNKFTERIEKYENNISDLLKAKFHPYDSYIKDLKEQDAQLIENKYEQIKSETNAIGIKNMKLDEIYTNKFNNMNKDLQDNYKKVQEEIENNMNILKTYIKKNMDEYSLHVDNDLYKKFEVLSKDIKDNFYIFRDGIDMRQELTRAKNLIEKSYKEERNKWLNSYEYSFYYLLYIVGNSVSEKERNKLIKSFNTILGSYVHFKKRIATLVVIIAFNLNPLLKLHFFTYN